MKVNKGFSLTEILLVIFTVAVIAAAIFPLKIINHSQAEKIATWKNFYPQLEYAFDAMISCEKNLPKVFFEDKNLSPDAFFDIYTNFLNVDKQKTQKTDFSKYHQYFLNGKIIKRISKYNADKYVVLQNGMIIAFKKFDRISDEHSPLGILMVDVNGKSRRDFIGRDVFAVLMYTDRIEPVGKNSSRQEMKEDCSPVGSGLKCSAYYLVGGNF